MSKELEQALIFFAGVVVGGVWIFVIAIWLWLGEKHYSPSIHTCSKHNYTGTKDCPDCRQAVQDEIEFYKTHSKP